VTLPDTPFTPAIDRYQAAVYENQRQWVHRVGAVAVSGQSHPVFASGGLLAVRTGATGAVMLPNPPDEAITSVLDAFDWLRKTGSSEVLIWAAAPHRQIDRWLSAHGARESFTPLWMTRSAHQPLDPLVHNAITVRPARPNDLVRLLEATDLPYYSHWQARATLRLATQDGSPEVALVVAVERDRIIGRAVLSCCDHPLGRTAGVYDVGVAPNRQRRGVGRQLMHALIDIARQQDADFVTLNATPAGEHLYRSLGFEDVGEGQTWLLPAATLRVPPPDRLVRFAMLISGGGDLGPMRDLAGQQMANGDTPLAHAARFDQPESALQLLDLGTIPDLAALWHLGFREQARRLMSDRNALNARLGQQGATPLHTAIYWDDLEFLDALLAAGADPHVRDTTFDSDAWGWCHALGNDAALEVLNARATPR